MWYDFMAWTTLPLYYRCNTRCHNSKTSIWILTVVITSNLTSALGRLSGIEMVPQSFTPAQSLWYKRPFRDRPSRHEYMGFDFLYSKQLLMELCPSAFAEWYLYWPDLDFRAIHVTVVCTATSGFLICTCRVTPS